MRTAEQHGRDLERGRECYARRAWADAYDALARADEVTPLGPQDLELLGWSASLTGRDEELLRCLERLYQLHLDAGTCIAAARAAFWVGFACQGRVSREFRTRVPCA